MRCWTSNRELVLFSRSPGLVDKKKKEENSGRKIKSGN